MYIETVILSHKYVVIMCPLKTKGKKKKKFH
jgi:hypothetical protein